ncbi:MAG: HNH endonuclease [Dehalococcoidales bacterium]|nr:HNH endonuclease [Dehalococcoidales bacterium]
MDNSRDITMIEQFVDYLLPELTPYESTLYLYLLRNSIMRNGTNQIRIGKRTLAEKFCKASRGENVSYAQVSKMLDNLEQKNCIQIGDTDRFGTLYKVVQPRNIPLVIEKIAQTQIIETEEDYFNDPENRLEIFNRDDWICQYCGDKVTQQNASLDHYIPQSQGGKHNKDNLRTCCLTCNSIKSGKTYEESAPLLLKSIRERKVKLGKE